MSNLTMNWLTLSEQVVAFSRFRLVRLAGLKFGSAKWILSGSSLEIVSFYSDYCPIALDLRAVGHDHASGPQRSLGQA
jgi:hypothetical protein